MKNVRYLIGVASYTVACLVVSAARAQDLDQPALGQVLARQICSECHAIEKRDARSPHSVAPRFEDIANSPGMSTAALTAALQTSHRTMPNVILQPDELATSLPLSCHSAEVSDRWADFLPR